MKKILSIVLLVVLISPILSFADINGPTIPGTGTQPGPTFSGPVYTNVSSCSNRNIQGLLTCVGQIINNVIPYTASLALFYFLWGVSGIIRAQGDMEKIKAGRKTAFWGVIALFILISIGGITLFLQHDLLGGVSNSLP